MYRPKSFFWGIIFLLFFLGFQSQKNDQVLAEKVKKSNSFTLTAIKQTNDSLLWKLEIKQPGEEESEIFIFFDEDQVHESIEGPNEAQMKKTKNGYFITIPEEMSHENFIIRTSIREVERDEYMLAAKMKSGTKKVKEIARIKNQANKNKRKDKQFKKRKEEQEEKIEEYEHEKKEQKRYHVEHKGEGHSSEKEENSSLETDLSAKESIAVEAKEEKSDYKNIIEGGQKEEETIQEMISSFTKTTKPQAISGKKSGDVWPDPGSLKLDKQARETNRFAEWDVELRVQGKNLKTSSDIVLVFDRSNSMYGSRTMKAKAAAKEFVNNLLIDEHSTVRIALVPFGSNTGTNYDPHTDFQDFAGKLTLLDAIDAIQIYQTHDSGGTNIQAGLRAAEVMLKDSTAEQKTIVLLSDGEPTYSYQAKSAAAYSWPEQKYDFILSDFNYNRRVGNGSSYNLPSGFLGIGGDRYTVDGYRVNDNGIATISKAQKIINSGIDIYSIGLEVGNVPHAIYTLQNSHNKGYYQGDEDDLSPIFNEIAASLAYAATEAIVTDPLGDMFHLVKDGSFNGEHFKASHGTVEWDESSETFTWDIGSIKEGETYTLTYKVTLDCTKDPKVWTKYPTNQVTTMNYIDGNGSNASKDFPIPEVKIQTVKVNKLGYRVNVEGEPVDSNGQVVHTPEKAEIFYHEFHREGLEPNDTYQVPAGDTPEGFILHPSFTDPAFVEVTDVVCQMAFFGYVKESELPAGDVTVKHIDEDGKELVPSKRLTGYIHDSYQTEKRDIDGYEFLKMHEDSDDPSGTFTYDEQTVIYVYKPLKGTIKLMKVDAEDADQYLKGAIFSMENDEGEKVGELVTDDEGIATSEPLPMGQYRLVETKAPFGYELPEYQELIVTVEPDEEVQITFTNQALKGSLKVVKVDADETEKYLEGAIFELTDEKGQTMEGTTDSDGEIVFADLAIGTYTLIETKAPAGYRLLNNPIDIEITPDEFIKEKTIVNHKQDWEIPQTGGIGTLGFYGIGALLMGVALWFTFRRSRI